MQNKFLYFIIPILFGVLCSFPVFNNDIKADLNLSFHKSIDDSVKLSFTDFAKAINRLVEYKLISIENQNGEYVAILNTKEQKIEIALTLLSNFSLADGVAGYYLLETVYKGKLEYFLWSGLKFNAEMDTIDEVLILTCQYPQHNAVLFITVDKEFDKTVLLQVAQNLKIGE